MWKKEGTPTPAEPTPKTEAPMTRQGPGRSSTETGERAAIGRSITIRGEVTGNEDLLIQGHVDGSVDLKKQAVTVGQEGEVKANITGRIVTVEGLVEGNLNAEEQVILRSSARVQGDITAPRVVLEDGANFRGGLDMGDWDAKGKSTSPGRSAGSEKSSTKGQSGAEKASGGQDSKAETPELVSGAKN